MSDIQEEQKRLYKRAEENDLKATMKPLFPDDVEMICISKDDYDRLYGDLTYENIKLKDKINKVIEYIKENTEFVHDGDEYGYMEYYNINEDTTYFIHHLLELLGVNDGIMD